MPKERKINPVVRKLNFAQAEIADDKYWAKASVDERLQELIDLRKMVFGSPKRIKKVVKKRSMFDDE